MKRINPLETANNPAPIPGCHAPEGCCAQCCGPLDSTYQLTDTPASIPFGKRVRGVTLRDKVLSTTDCQQGLSPKYPRERDVWDKTLKTKSLSSFFTPFFLIEFPFDLSLMCLFCCRVWGDPWSWRWQPQGMHPLLQYTLHFISKRLLHQRFSRVDIRTKASRKYHDDHEWKFGGLQTAARHFSF